MEEFYSLSEQKQNLVFDFMNMVGTESVELAYFLLKDSGWNPDVNHSPPRVPWTPSSPELTCHPQGVLLATRVLRPPCHVVVITHRED